MRQRSQSISILLMTGIWSFLLIVAWPCPLPAQTQESSGYMLRSLWSSSETVLRTRDPGSSTSNPIRSGLFPDDVYTEFSGQNRIQPLASFEIGAGKLDILAGFDFYTDSFAGSRQSVWVNSLFYQHELFSSPFAGYVELSSEYNLEQDQGWDGIYSAGIVYHVSGNIQIDAGFQFEQYHGGNDLAPILNFNMRF